MPSVVSLWTPTGPSFDTRLTLLQPPVSVPVRYIYPLMVLLFIVPEFPVM